MCKIFREHNTLCIWWCFLFYSFLLSPTFFFLLPPPLSFMISMKLRFLLNFFYLLLYICIWYLWVCIWAYHSAHVKEKGWLWRIESSIMQSRDRTQVIGFQRASLPWDVPPAPSHHPSKPTSSAFSFIVGTNHILIITHQISIVHCMQEDKWLETLGSDSTARCSSLQRHMRKKTSSRAEQPLWPSWLSRMASSVYVV